MGDRDTDEDNLAKEYEQRPLSPIMVAAKLGARSIGVHQAPFRWNPGLNILIWYHVPS